MHHPKTTEKLFFFFSGGVISVPFPLLVTSVFLYFLRLSLPQFYAILISAVIIAPIFEEFARAFPLFYRHGETERSLVILGFLVGLGFGLTEFIFYVFMGHVNAYFRLPLMFFHATNTAIVAYGISQNRSFVFYLLAVFLHAFNNFAGSFGGYWIIGNLIAILSSYFLAAYLYKKSKEKTVDYWV